MKLRNVAKNIHKYDNIKDWAKDIKQGMKSDLKCSDKQTNDTSDINNFLEGKYVGEYIRWFLENYFN